MAGSSPYKFFQVHDGDPWFEDQGYNHEECCDCGLVHRVRYLVFTKDGKRIRDAKIQVTAWRAKNQTRVRRRLRKKGIVVLP